jgi:hypothetical protein
MAGVLEFALGLKSSEFLSELGVSSRAIVAVGAAMEGLKFTAEKVWAAVEQGAALKELADRTNQSTESLYRMEEGFKGVGLGAEAVPGMILKMQRALSGVNEMGEKTGFVFTQLGLNMTKLRGESAEQSLNEIGAALAKMGTNNAAGAASAIFGRFGAGDILQLARGMQEYQRVMNATKGDATVFGAMADAWSDIKNDAVIFGSHLTRIAQGDGRDQPDHRHARPGHCRRVPVRQDFYADDGCAARLMGNF